MPLSQQDFLATYGDYAGQIASETGLDRNVVLGLMAHESGWGNHYVGFNPFGMMRQDGSPQMFSNVGDAGRAFITLMHSPTYTGVSSLNPGDQAKALRAAGYNTVDPNWLPGVTSAANTVRSLSAPAKATNVAAPSVDDLRKQLGDTFTSSKPAAQPAAPGQPATAAPATAGAPSLDDIRRQTQEVFPSGPRLPADGGGVTAGPGGPSTFPKPAAPAADKPPADTKAPTGSAAVAAAPASESGLPSLPSADDPGVQATQRIIQAGKEGWNNTEPTLTEYGHQLSDKYLGPIPGAISDYLIDPLRRVGSAAGNALLQGVYEVGSGLGGPSLGRDLATMAIVAPAAQAMPEPSATMGVPKNVFARETAPPAPPPAAPPNFLDPAMAAREADIRAPAISPSELRRSILRQQGLSDAAIDAMSPADADRLIRQGAPVAPSAAVVPPPAAAPPVGQPWSASQIYENSMGRAPSPAAAPLPEPTRAHLRGLGFSDPDIDAITPSDAADIIRQNRPVGPAQEPTPRTGQEALQRPPPEPRAQPNAAEPHDEVQEVDSEDAHRSAGAAGTPRGQIPPPTPAMRARDLRMSIDESAFDRTQNLIDNNAYVPDIPERPLYQKDFSPLNALDQKIAYADPAHRALADDIERNRNSGMVEGLRNDAGDDVSLDNARTHRRGASPDAMGVFRNEQAVDASNIVNSIDRTMDDEKSPAVLRTLQTVHDMLHDREDNLETLPSRLYNAKTAVDNLLDKAAKPGIGDREATDAAASARQLRTIRGQINAKIQEGASGYDAYRQEYRARSQPINQQTFLQRYFQGTKNIVGSDGKLVLEKVNRMLEDIYHDLKDPRDRLAKSLTDEQVQNILNVRNELAARKLAADQARVSGADTFQQLRHAANTDNGTLARILFHSAAAGAHGAAVMAAGVNPLLHGILGSVQGMYEFTKPARQFRAAQRAAAMLERETANRRAELLHQGPATRMGGPWLPYAPEGFSRTRPGRPPVPMQGNMLFRPPAAPPPPP